MTEVAKPRAGRASILLLNSLANILRAFSGSLTTILLPVFLVFLLPKSDYTVWALVYGMASYVMYLDLGLQASIQATVAHRHGAGDVRAAKKIAASGLKIVAAVCAFSILGSILVAWQLPSIFPQIPNDLLDQARVALLVLVGGQLCGLATNVASAYFAGLQRSLEPAVIATIARFASLGAVILCVPFSQNLGVLAAAFSLPIAAGLVAIVWRFSAERPQNETSITAVMEASAFDNRPWPLLVYSGPLMLWNICVLVVNGAGIVIVGLFAYESVAAFSIASMFAAAVVGVGNALTTPLLAEFSRVSTSKGGLEELRVLLRNAVRINSVIILGLAGGVLLLAPVFLELSGLAMTGVDEFVLVGCVVLAASLRLLMAPVTMVFIATGTHRRIVLPPVVEALLTLTITTVLASVYGAVGAGLGAFVGALIGVTLTLTWSLKSSGIALGGMSGILRNGLLVPVLCWIPSWAASLALGASAWPVWSSSAIVLVAFGSSAALAWFFGLHTADRSMMLRVARSFGRRVKVT
jgi:O-antigen/teichoic acid export membrane protein